MNLKNKFIFWCALLMALVLAVGTVSIWNIVGQLHVARATTEEYNVMDRADATSAQVGWLVACVIVCVESCEWVSEHSVLPADLDGSYRDRSSPSIGGAGG